MYIEKQTDLVHNVNADAINAHISPFSRQCFDSSMVSMGTVVSSSFEHCISDQLINFSMVIASALFQVAEVPFVHACIFTACIIDLTARALVGYP